MFYISVHDSLWVKFVWAMRLRLEADFGFFWSMDVQLLQQHCSSSSGLFSAVCQRSGGPCYCRGGGEHPDSPHGLRWHCRWESLPTSPHPVLPSGDNRPSSHLGLLWCPHPSWRIGAPRSSLEMVEVYTHRLDFAGVGRWQWGDLTVFLQCLTKSFLSY